MSALPRDLATAAHTAVAELPPDTHEDDVLDAVCGMTSIALVDTHEAELRRLIRRIR